MLFIQAKSSKNSEKSTLNKINLVYSPVLSAIRDIIAINRRNYGV